MAVLKWKKQSPAGAPLLLYVAACLGRGREIDAPEARTGLKKFQGSGPPVSIDADDAALEVSLCLQIRQQDSLFRNHANIDRHESASCAYVQGCGNF